MEKLHSPLISVLICTFNRSALLKRALNSVLMQDYGNFELIVIDDCSSDDTPIIVQSFNDKRIRYIRNEANMASIHGDRSQIRRFFYELARGQYLVYLCDDDYWVNNSLLRRQIEAFETYPDLAMVIGGQVSYAPSETLLDIKTIPQICYADLRKIPLPDSAFFLKALYPKCFMTSEEFLTLFSENPTARNLIAGATLYSKKHFLKARALSTPSGSRWQAGYELSMGPACYGNIVYIDSPEIIVTMLPSNASFQRSQLEHYQDGILSIDTAFQAPLADQSVLERRKFFNRIKRETIRNLTRTYLSNTIHIKRDGELTLCSKYNISKPVLPFHALQKYYLYSIFPKPQDLLLLYYTGLPTWLSKIQMPIILALYQIVRSLTWGLFHKLRKKTIK